eukprot:6459992-Amphidinium_carterae.1
MLGAARRPRRRDPAGDRCRLVLVQNVGANCTLFLGGDPGIAACDVGEGVQACGRSLSSFWGR